MRPTIKPPAGSSNNNQGFVSLISVTSSKDFRKNAEAIPTNSPTIAETPIHFIVNKVIEYCGIVDFIFIIQK